MEPETFLNLQWFSCNLQQLNLVVKSYSPKLPQLPWIAFVTNKCKIILSSIMKHRERLKLLVISDT